MKDKANLIEAFSEMAPRYEQVVDSELKRFWGWSYSGFVNILLASIPVEPNAVILDVATGMGVIPSHLVKAGLPLNRVHGLDITLAMLLLAKRRLGDQNGYDSLNLVCASAMDMPYTNTSFTHITCGLATHHMDVKQLLSESYRVLKWGGKLTIADAGGSNFWKIPGVRLLLRIVAFIYFFLNENKSRAWAESDAVANVLSKDAWNRIVTRSGFHNIVIQELKSRYFWAPAPLLIKAEK